MIIYLLGIRIKLLIRTSIIMQRLALNTIKKGLRLKMIQLNILQKIEIFFN